MNNQMRLYIKKTVNYAWNLNKSNELIGLYHYGNDNFIGTDNEARSKGLNPNDAVIRIAGGIQSVDLSGLELVKICHKLQQNQLNYLYNLLVSNQVVAPNVPLNEVKVDQTVAAFLAATFPDVLTNFYDSVVKTTRIKEAIKAVEK